MDGFSGKYRSILSTGIPANIDWESTIIDFFRGITWASGGARAVAWPRDVLGTHTRTLGIDDD
jgi:hypothetical protein